MSNFSFWHDVFKSHLLQMHKNTHHTRKGLTSKSATFIWNLTSVQMMSLQCRIDRLRFNAVFNTFSVISYSYVSWFSHTSNPHNILSKQLAAFPHRPLAHWWKINVTVTFVKCRKECWPSWGSNSLPLDWQPMQCFKHRFSVNSYPQTSNLPQMNLKPYGQKREKPPSLWV